MTDSCNQTFNENHSSQSFMVTPFTRYHDGHNYSPRDYQSRVRFVPNDYLLPQNSFQNWIPPQNSYCRDHSVPPRSVSGPPMMRHPPWCGQPSRRVSRGPARFPDLPSQMVAIPLPPPPPLPLRGGHIRPLTEADMKFRLYTDIVNQVDYYFSRENLIKDLYLRCNMDEQGWVSISLIAGFNKIKLLMESIQVVKEAQSIQVVKEALKTSSIVEVQDYKIRIREDWKTWIIVPTPTTSESQQ